MKIAYFGSSQFACVVLGGLIDQGVKPLIVVTQPDAPKGRGFKLTPTPVKAYAESATLPVYSSHDFEALAKDLKGKGIDLFIVVAYGNILPKFLLDVPQIMPIALHPSLLPQYRGAAPMQWTLINGEEKTGVTVFKVNEHLDAGEILIKEEIAIDEVDTMETLSEKLMQLGIKTLARAVKAIEKGNYTLRPQDTSKVSFAPKITKEDGRISWHVDADRIRNQIRGLAGWPGAFTYYKGTMLKILDAEVRELEACEEPARVVAISQDGISVATGRSVLTIKRVKPQNSREMTAHAFVCGHKIEVGEKFQETP